MNILWVFALQGVRGGTKKEIGLVEFTYITKLNLGHGTHRWWCRLVCQMACSLNSRQSDECWTRKAATITYQPFDLQVWPWHSTWDLHSAHCLHFVNIYCKLFKNPNSSWRDMEWTWNIAICVSLTFNQCDWDLCSAHNLDLVNIYCTLFRNSFKWSGCGADTKRNGRTDRPMEGCIHAHTDYSYTPLQFHQSGPQ